MPRLFWVMGPVERDPLAGTHLEGGPEGVGRLAERVRPRLPLAQDRERGAEVVLGPGPVERDPLAGALVGDPAVEPDRLLERCVVPELVALPVECVCLLIEVAE